MSERLSTQVWDICNELTDAGLVQYIRPLTDIAYRISRYEKALRLIRSGLIRRGKNTSYGGGKSGTLRRAEMMDLARRALIE